MVYFLLAFIKRTHSQRLQLAFSNNYLHCFLTLSLGSIILRFQRGPPVFNPPQTPAGFMVRLEVWCKYTVPPV